MKTAPIAAVLLSLAASHPALAKSKGPAKPPRKSVARTVQPVRVSASSTLEKRVLLAAASPRIAAEPAPRPQQAPAESSALPQTVLSTHPLFLLGIYSLEYQRVLSPHAAMFVEGTYISMSVAQTSGGQFSVGARYFFGGEAPQGLFASGVLGGGYSNSTTGKFASGQVGALLGYTFLPWRVLAISLGAGGCIAHDQVLEGGGQSGFRPGLLLRGSVGFAF